ncbi:mCG1025634, isoform CRA_b [Mus musculus]|nr:mCG1025634, isoform CRA_b [Mus musculus]
MRSGAAGHHVSHQCVLEDPRGGWQSGLSRRKRLSLTDHMHMKRHILLRGEHREALMDTYDSGGLMELTWIPFFSLSFNFCFCFSRQGFSV